MKAPKELSIWTVKIISEPLHALPGHTFCFFTDVGVAQTRYQVGMVVEKTEGCRYLAQNQDAAGQYHEGKGFYAAEE